ncbi:pilus assembly protein [Aeromonas sp. SG16]|uniref:pilus assembly protein n=1 Tax=Aeromonas sp. SG16 TaxID=2950548 RepID=UPI00210AEB61|nr:PilC/PilY family type IV pilus protein [Aeromonas sp. SG16]MCQ4055289.1 PilC/PilY family type IV pilus protein [Aeromonas sp. SG16]
MREHGRALLLCTVMAAMPVLASSSYSDDTELFIYDFSKAGDFRPKILVIFDNSGSMRETMYVGEDYDKNKKYPPLDDDPDIGDDKNYIYFSTDGSIPSITSSQRFSDKINACASSKIPLSTVGFFQSQVWRYRYSSYSGGLPRQGIWETVSGRTESDFTLIDCKQDISSRNQSNPYSGTGLLVGGITSGYPVNKSSNSGGLWYYTTNINSVASGSNTSVTLYSANYIRWYYGPTSLRLKSRLQVAKDAVKGLISSTPGVDFGLAVYNYNDSDGSKSGGRIVRRILSNDTDMGNGVTAENNLLSTIDSLGAETNTPLCETLYEAYRFFGGQEVYFGDDDDSRTPTRDKLAEYPVDTYKAPYDKCSNNGYVIYITDGEPTQDTNANSLVQGLISTLNPTEKAAYGTTVGYGTRGSTSYLAALAGYMKNKDVNPGSSGIQTVTTFTVGFGDDAVSGAGNLLAETARRGGGLYYPATSAEALSQALKSSLLAILRINTSLVSPAIATNNFDRTRSLNNIYYAMFEPDTGPRWKGNLKKLVLSDKGYVVDTTTLPAIKSDGTILEGARTFWSSEDDGNLVAKGGVQEMLADKSNRNLYLINDKASPKRLDSFTRSNAQTMAGSAEALRLLMQLSDVSELDNMFSWITGSDVDNEDNDSSTTVRKYILGDPLHSRPLVINYGCTIAQGQTSCTPDLRIIMGTNAGFLHMFKDLGSSVDETWAMMPYPLLATQKALRQNSESSAHVFGVDSSPVALIKDANQNGVIKASEGDYVWMFVGLRSGGKNYYAFDVTNPDAPTLKWSITPDSGGFSQLGQTWSVPEVAFVPGVTDPVVIFAGGYDLNKSTLGLGSSDSSGAGIYIVNANTGGLIYSATPAANSTTNLQVSTMLDSMPGSVATLDSDGDGKVDRIYASDTGGNIWRMDLPGTNKTDWSVFKFASLGSDTQQSEDRRFFTQPVLVRTINKGWEVKNSQYVYSERPFDAVLIGSGDRNRPSSESTVSNAYFMLRDYQVVPKSYRTVTPPSAITIDQLYDVTTDPFLGKTDAQILTIKKSLTSKMGWKYWLDETGEKSMGAGVVLQGKLYFTSFLPQVQSFEECTIQSIGAMRQYMVDMHYGTSFRYTVDQDGNQSPERYVEVNNKVADDLVVHAGDDAKIRIIGGAPGEEVILKDDGNNQPTRCTGAGQCSEGADEAEMDMTPKKIYLYEDEPQ